MAKKGKRNCENCASGIKSRHRVGLVFCGLDCRSTDAQVVIKLCGNDAYVKPVENLLCWRTREIVLNNSPSKKGTGKRPVVGKVYHGDDMPSLEMNKVYHYVLGVDDSLETVVKVTKIEDPEVEPR